MYLTGRIIGVCLALATLPYCKNEPNKLFERGVRKLGFEPVALSHGMPLGSIVALSSDPTKGPELICLGCSNGCDSPSGPGFPHGAVTCVESGFSHRLEFYDVSASHMSDIEEQEMARHRSEACIKMVQARRAAGFEIRIVRGVLRSAVADNNTTYRPMGVVGVQMDELLWALGEHTDEVLLN